MTHRRTDVVYFALLVAVGLIGYQLSGWWTDDHVPPADPTYRPPALTLPEPSIELPEPFFAFRYKGAGRLVAPDVTPIPFADEMQKALEQVRAALLEDESKSGAEAPSRQTAQLAGVIE